jgi:pyruvate kinase
MLTALTEGDVINLYPGTTGYYIDIPFSQTSMEQVPECLRHLWQTGDLLDDDMILVTAVGYPTSGNRMNLIEIHVVSDLKQALRWERK